MPKWAIFLALAILVMGVLLSYVGLGTRLDDKGQIEALVADVESATNAHDWGRVLSHVATDYHDDSGFNKDKLRALAMQASRLEPFHVDAAVKGVALYGEQRAGVVVHVVITRGEGTPETYEVTVGLTKTKSSWWQKFRGHGWVVTSAEGWQGAVGSME